MKFADEGKLQPAGTQFLGLIDSLIDIFKEPEVSDVEVVFTSLKVDEKGEAIVEDGQNIAEIRPIGIRLLNDVVKEELRKAYEARPLRSLLVLWMRRDGPNKRKMGKLKFQPVEPGKLPPKTVIDEPQDKVAISDYLRRRVSKS
jgi:hypothetical protein